jgi:hypothetical protein
MSLFIIKLCIQTQTLNEIFHGRKKKQNLRGAPKIPVAALLEYSILDIKYNKIIWPTIRIQVFLVLSATSRMKLKFFYNPIRE